MNLEDLPSLVIPCASMEKLKTLVDLLYDNEILTDETICFQNCPENIIDILNKKDFFEPVEIGGIGAIKGQSERITEELL